LGTRLDSLYPTSTSAKWLDYKEIDEIVRDYKESKDPQIIAARKGDLLKAFHKYFMKYVSLLKGTIGSIENGDTKLFLALFLAGSTKHSNSYLGIYKYIVYVCKQFDDTDIYNELAAMFIALLDRFEFYPEVSFSRYITKYMRWSIKAWIMGLTHNPLSRSPVEYGPYLEIFDSDSNENHVDLELPNMDLSWVSGSTSPLFSILTRYERFLLYLNYKEGLGVRQISERLGRAKDTIHSHIQQALEKLREQYQKGEQ